MLLEQRSTQWNNCVMKTLWNVDFLNSAQDYHIVLAGEGGKNKQTQTKWGWCAVSVWGWWLSPLFASVHSPSLSSSCSVLFLPFFSSLCLFLCPFLRRWDVFVIVVPVWDSRRSHAGDERRWGLWKAGRHAVKHSHSFHLHMHTYKPALQALEKYS